MLGATRDRVEWRPGRHRGLDGGAARPGRRVLAEGYRRIKLKIEPGTDVERVRAVREAHPDILLSVDANAAYTLDDLEVFRALDAFGLLMVEQPLHQDDLWEHAEPSATDLDRRVRTSRSVRRPTPARRSGSAPAGS